MATTKKNTAASVSSAAQAPAPAAKAAPAPASKPAAKPAAKSAAKPAVAKAAPARKTPAKPAPKPAAKPLDPAVQASKEALAKALAAAQAVKIEKPLGKPAKAEKPKADKEVKAPKAKKTKLVRDSFTMPENEYSQLAELKKRLVAKGVVAKKSELLRAGVALLVALGDAELVATMQKVEVIKTGRPSKSGK